MIIEKSTWQELADFVGADAARALSDAHGGHEIYIPTHESPRGSESISTRFLTDALGETPPAPFARISAAPTNAGHVSAAVRRTDRYGM
ncbi:MAG: hypothetical protein JWR21_4353 [Herminiimonas sp.]|nr:hypothetical protein [Herminiimonas sp.]